MFTAQSEIKYLATKESLSLTNKNHHHHPSFDYRRFTPDNCSIKYF